jgi:hypothetical protein
MADATTDNAVEQALRDLGAALDAGTPSTGFTVAVLERVAAEPLPSRSLRREVASTAGARVRGRLSRLVAGLLVALGLTGAAVSPVGAELVDWFHGVLVTEDPGAPTGEPDVPAADGGLTLDRAADRVGFRPYVPDALGPPDAVEVSADLGLLSMSWEVDGATIRLDQFDAGLSPTFWKSSREAHPVQVGQAEGLWFPVPHQVVLLVSSDDPDGPDAEVAVPPRLAGRTLIWPLAGRTLRLEGDLTLDRALEIAASAR